MMTEEILLEVKHLHTDFVTGEKTIHAVNDVSFQIIKGETFGLIGESGCGKSATCKSLIRLMREQGRITCGDVLYQGENLLTYTEKEMRKIRGREISMVFQNPMTTLNPVLTIKEQLVETMADGDGSNPKRSRKEKALEAEKLLEMVGIAGPKEVQKRYAHQLSGGMRQRVMIAIALAARPHLLLLDEPTTALDVTIQAQLIDLLLQLKKELDMSMLLVTHNLGVAAQMCDHIAVMYAGKVMEMADAETILRRPKHPYTYGLMQSIPSIERMGERLYSLEGAPPDLGDMPQGCPFAPRCVYCEDICRKEVPQLREVETGHFLRCHCLGLGGLQ